MTSQNSVCAVVVTFHPQQEVLENLRKVRPQVQGLVVVDNGSALEALEPLRIASRELDFMLIENGENLGIATALNRGIRWADEHGFKWVVLFDQDSTVTDEFIHTMVSEFINRSVTEKIGVIVPRYIRRGTGESIPSWSHRNQFLQVTRTSGSLIPMTVLKELGGFIDEMFIDMVDYEYSLRLRRADYLLLECRQATLVHSPAFPKKHHFWGKQIFSTSNYGAARRYYIERNTIHMITSYWFTFPGFCTALIIRNVKEIIKVCLLEKDRLYKLRKIALGFWHGISGMMGRRVEL